MAALRQRVFRRSERPAGGLAAYFEEIFFANPWRREGLESLVLDDGDGGVAGFVGVVPRRMEFEGRAILAVVATQFMVAPEHRGVLAGRRLARAVVGGPQDLTLSDAANDGARRIMESVGGVTALAHSLYWTRPLRPLRHALARHAERGLPRVAARAVRPLCDAGDALGRWRHDRRPADASRDAVELLDLPRQLPELGVVFRDWTLRPRYDAASLAWLLRQTARKPGVGPLEQLLVRDAQGRVLGWCIYGANRGGVGEVIQLAARRGRAGRVLGQLFDHARRRGLLALSGRVAPAALQELADAGCVITRDGPWTLVHSRHPGVTDALARGDALVSRLDGEWWLSF